MAFGAHNMAFGSGLLAIENDNLSVAIHNMALDDDILALTAIPILETLLTPIKNDSYINTNRSLIYLTIITGHSALFTTL